MDEEQKIFLILAKLFSVPGTFVPGTNVPGTEMCGSKIVGQDGL